MGDTKKSSDLIPYPQGLWKKDTVAEYLITQEISFDMSNVNYTDKVEKEEALGQIKRLARKEYEIRVAFENSDVSSVGILKSELALLIKDVEKEQYAKVLRIKKEQEVKDNVVNSFRKFRSAETFKTHIGNQRLSFIKGNIYTIAPDIYAILLRAGKVAVL